jgi:hypothetical protein
MIAARFSLLGDMHTSTPRNVTNLGVGRGPRIRQRPAQWHSTIHNEFSGETKHAAIPRVKQNPDIPSAPEHLTVVGILSPGAGTGLATDGDSRCRPRALPAPQSVAACLPSRARLRQARQAGPTRRMLRFPPTPPDALCVPCEPRESTGPTPVQSFRSCRVNPPKPTSTRRA